MENIVAISPNQKQNILKALIFLTAAGEKIYFHINISVGNTAPCKSEYNILCSLHYAIIVWMLEADGTVYDTLYSLLFLEAQFSSQILHREHDFRLQYMV